MTGKNIFPGFKNTLKKFLNLQSQNHVCFADFGKPSSAKAMEGKDGGSSSAG